MTISDLAGPLSGLGNYQAAQMAQQASQWVTTSSATANNWGAVYTYLAPPSVATPAHSRDERDWLRGRIREIEWRP